MNNLFAIILLVIGLILVSVDSYAEQPAPDTDIYYYHQGRLAAERLQKNTALSSEQVEKAIEGFVARLKNQPPAYTAADTQHAIEQHHEQKQRSLELLSQQNQNRGEAYLRSLEADPDYQFLDFGLAYKIKQAGDGAVPGGNHQVRLNYVGRHLDGREFDRTEKPGWYNMQSILPGWRVALMNMPVGSRWTIVVPPHMAYGERGAGDRVEPQETLIYDLLLLQMK